MHNPICLRLKKLCWGDRRTVPYDCTNTLVYLPVLVLVRVPVSRTLYEYRTILTVAGNKNISNLETYNKE